MTYLHGDHLGSVSASTNSSGVLIAQRRFTPFGAVRQGAETLPTKRGFTGLYYHPGLARLASADSIVPGMAEGKGGAAASLGYTQQQGFWFQMDEEDKQAVEGAKWPWGQGNAQALNPPQRRAEQSAALHDPTAHCPVGALSLGLHPILRTGRVAVRRGHAHFSSPASGSSVDVDRCMTLLPAPHIPDTSGTSSPCVQRTPRYPRCQMERHR